MNCERKACTLLLSLLLAGIFPLAPTAKGAQEGRTEATRAGYIIDVLTEEERAWLRDHPVITVAHDPDWAPVEFSDERGELTGISGDYLNLVEQRLGLKFKRIPNLSWQEAFARQQRWEIDMATCVAAPPVRYNFWAFTKPYLSIPIVIATRSDVGYIGEMKELFGKPVAVVKNYAIDDWVTRDFPEIPLARFNTVPEGLAALQRGEVFAYLDNLLIIGDYQAKLKVTNIKIAGQTPYVNAQRMAVRKDWAPLAGILDKALDSIPETQRLDIYRKWVPLRYEYGFDHALLWKALAGFAVILLALVVWNRRLARAIKQRQRAEVALRDSRALHHDLVETSQDLIWQCDAEGRYIYLNPAWEGVFGYRLEEMLGRSFADFQSPECAARDAREFTRLLQSGSVKAYETVHRAKDGRALHLVFNAKSVTDEAGRVLGTRGTAYDITERKRAEEELAHSDALMRYIIEHNRSAVAVHDREMRYLYVSQRYLDDYQVKERDIIGKHHYEVFPDLPQKWRDVHRQVLTGRVMSAEDDPYEKADGSVEWTRWECRPWYEAEGSIGGLIVYTEVITERKRTEEALRESEERFVSFMRHLPGFAFVKDHDRRVLYVNELFETAFGLPLPEWQGKTNDEIWPGEVGEKIRRDDEAVLAAGEPRAIIESVPTHGELRTYRTIKFPIPRPDGRPWLGGMSVDITELKQTEAALRASLEEKESLLKEVHHRVKNNLQVVSSLLSLQFRQVKNAELRSFLRDTRNRISSMAMLHEILYRSDNFAKIDFREYVKSVCTHLAHSYGSDAKNTRLKQEIADVTLNPDQAITAGLIINELVANAFKHAFPSRSDGEILVELQAAGEHHLVLRVSDNGVGFPAGRSPQSAETLGLLLVSNLSRQLDGQLSVTGEQGTVFQIIFPAHSV